MSCERVLLFTDDAMVRHDPGCGVGGHPERPERLASILDDLRFDPIAGASARAPKPVAAEKLEAVHGSSYVASVLALDGQVAHLDADTIVGPDSIHAARLAAGAAVDAVEAVTTGVCESAFALVRPPGHHAEPDRAMGFCLFNNIAVAAEHAIRRGRAGRVLIVDWDVHHGNGTQTTFYERDDVLLFSIHQWPFYPGTGSAKETGAGVGTGFTINVPAPPGWGDPEYLDAFDRVLKPAAAAFGPDLVLVSAGFDAHTRDPLGSMDVSTDGFGMLCERVTSLATEHADGRLVLVLEGGYDVIALCEGVRVCAETMVMSTKQV